MLIDFFILPYVPLGATDHDVFSVISFLSLTFSLFIFCTFSLIRQELGVLGVAKGAKANALAG